MCTRLRGGSGLSSEELREGGVVGSSAWMLRPGEHGTGRNTPQMAARFNGGLHQL